MSTEATSSSPKHETVETSTVVTTVETTSSSVEHSGSQTETAITPEVKDKEVPALPDIPAEETPATRPNPTKRLSLFLGKAKHFVDKVSHPPKKTTETTTTTTTTAAVDDHAPVLTSPVTEDTAVPTPTPAVVAEPEVIENTEVSAEPAVEEAEVKSPKQDKRKSFLAGLFRSKSPVKELEKTEEVPAVKEETANEVDKAEVADVKDDKVVIQETAQTEHTETPAATAEITEASATKEHKENVIDQIKRGPLAKFFNKKKEPTEVKEEVAADVPEVTTDEAVVPTETEVETPVKEETTPADEKNSRPSSPIGRRITQMFRISHKKKSATAVPTEEEDKEEVKEEPKETVVEVPAPVVTEQTREPKEEILPKPVVQSA